MIGPTLSAFHPRAAVAPASSETQRCVLGSVHPISVFWRYCMQSNSSYPLEEVLKAQKALREAAGSVRKSSPFRHSSV